MTAGSKSTVFMLVKVVAKQEHADAFVRGSLFMNSLAYFRDFKDPQGILRGDPYEGIGAIWQPSQIGELRVGDISIPPADLGGPVLLQNEGVMQARVFCTYAANSRGFEAGVSSENLADLKRVLQVHQSCYGFGSIAIVVTNFREFRDRFVRAVKAADRSVVAAGYAGLVEYYDEETHHGNFHDKPGFHKRLQYADQREYRLMVRLRQPPQEPYTFEIGDLSDIVKLTTPEEFNRELKIGLPDGSQA